MLLSPHALMCDLIGMALEADPKIDLDCREWPGSEEGLGGLASTADAPQVVLVDGMNNIDGGLGGAVTSVRSAFPGAAIVAIAQNDEDPALADALIAGACAFVTMNDNLESLSGALRAAAASETAISSDLARRMLERARETGGRGLGHTGGQNLTERELAVLDLVALGEGNQAIGTVLGVSPNTVKNHLRSIFRKLGVASRGQAVAEAVRRGLVSRG